MYGIKSGTSPIIGRMKVSIYTGMTQSASNM